MHEIKLSPALNENENEGIKYIFLLMQKIESKTTLPKRHSALTKQKSESAIKQSLVIF